MADRLSTYRKMRRFDVTPEPSGEGDEANASNLPRFVIQEHHATALHWDFRLERDGVLVSWAIPRGLPPDPKTNHLAIHTEDHPLSYIDFEGEIPEGEYGGGRVILWDTGTYETHKFGDREVMVTLHGQRARGKYVLFQTDGKNWMVHRMDPPDDPSREPMPERVLPMLAKPGKLPRDDHRYGFEIKWDGIRAILYSSGGRARIESRNLLDITRQYPEIRRLGAELGTTEVILDGEIVAFDENGRPSFQRLQNRMGLTSESVIRRRAAETPAVYIIFDVLFLDGHSTLALAYTERRRLLEQLELAGPAWQTPGYHRGDGEAMLAASRERGLEGVVAKRLDSPYEPGRRSGWWLKIKNQLGQELVIAGWTRGEGARANSIGALLVGYYDITREEAERTGKSQRLHYAGKVGTGFTDRMLADLQARLTGLRRDTSPFDAGKPPKGSYFAEPRLVGEFNFTEWTRDGTLRQPSFKGLRADKDPGDVVRES
jgi:bifunctional non-homologous end joining protein LigD